MRLLLSLCLLTFLTLSAASDQNPRVEERDITDLVFSDIERHIIMEYFSGLTTERKHGEGDRLSNWDEDIKQKGKDKGLPPGLGQQLERNGKLPPGLAKRDLPYDLVSRLPLLPKTHQRLIINEDIVLIKKATGRILDILVGVVRQ